MPFLGRAGRAEQLCYIMIYAVEYQESTIMYDAEQHSLAYIRVC